MLWRSSSTLVDVAVVPQRQVPAVGLDSWDEGLIFQGPVHRYRARSRVHRDTAPIIRCRTVVAYRQRHVIYIASGPPPPPPDVSSQVLLSCCLQGDSRGHHGHLAGRGVGSARRRRERRLRAALRHEQQTVAMVLSAALHHSAQVGADVLYAAPRSQKTDRTTGRRPGVLKEPVPPVVVEHAACPCSGALLLVVPSLAAAESDGVDGTSVKYFLKLALQKKKEEEKEEKKRKEEYEERMSVLNRRVRDGLPLTSAEDAAWRQWSCLLPRQEKRRKRKKRKKRRLPRTSSRPSRCRKLWRFRSCSFSTLSSSSPVVPQRQILMVQTIQQITEFPQFLYVSGRRCPCCAGRACHAVLTALVCTWLVFLVTLHPALCSCVFVWPKMLRIMAGMTQQDSCLEKYHKMWFLWEMTSYVSVLSSLVRQWMHISVSLRGLVSDCRKLRSSAVAVHRWTSTSFSCCGG